MECKRVRPRVTSECYYGNVVQKLCLVVCEMLLVLVVLSVIGAGGTRPDDGRAAGLLPDCPGSTKEAVITKKTLKHLSMVVINNNHTLGRHYNYYQVDRLANDPDIDLSKSTMIYVGGYLSSPFLPYNTGMGIGYKKLGYNVIMLDALMFNTIEYPRAARFLRVVGRHAAKMLAKLTSRGLDPKKLEIMGISLGGQTAGFIAKHYKNLTGVSVAKVVGLDAAGPCFRNLGPEDRLDKTDADFVINVATNIDGFGMAAPIAHINYYVNGGEHQPGPLFWIYCPDICSHTRAYEVWLSSLTHSNEFIAIKCDSVQQARDKGCFGRVPQVTNLLGPKADRNLEGIFYLSTTSTDPYYMGKRGLIKENDYFISISTALNEEDVLKM